MSEKKLPAIQDKALLKLAKTIRGMTLDAMSVKLGMKGSALSQNMSRDRMSLGIFGRILDVLGYDVVIVDRETGEECWKLDVADRSGMDEDI